MVQKILRTMQDDLRAIKETRGIRQQGISNPPREEQKEKESPVQTNNNLQQPTVNTKEPQTLETEQKAPVLASSISDSDNRNDRDKEIAKIREELERISINTIVPASTSQEEERLEKEKQEAEEEKRKEKEIEEQRRKIEEMQRKAEEERLEEERRAGEEAEKRRIEEERKQAEEKARLEAESKAREEAERQKIEEEKIRQEEEKARLQAEEDAQRKAQKEEEERREMEKSKEEKERQEAEEEERKEMEEKRKRIEREKERIEELKKRGEELEELKKRQEKIEMEEEIERKIEEERKTREEEEIRRMEELKAKEEEIKRAEEEARRQEEELARKEEDEIRKTEEEARKMEEEAEKIKTELARKEEELQRMEKEEKERIEELMRNEEDMREAEKELEEKERELEEKERERKKREELRKKMRAEILEEKLPEEKAEEESIIEEPELADEIIEENDLPPVIFRKDSTVQNDKRLEESEKYSASPLYEAKKNTQSATEEETYRETPAMANPPSRANIYASNTPANKKDEELSSLVRRVSNAMNTTKQEENAVPTAVQNPDKDKDIKELIARMSKDLEKEKEILEEEQQQENKDPLRPDLTETKIEEAPKAAELEIIPVKAEPAVEPNSEPLPIIPDMQPEGHHPAEPAALSQPAIESSIMQTAVAERTDSPQIEQPAGNSGSYWAELHDTLKNSADKPDVPTHASTNLEETGLIVPKETAQGPEQTEEFSLPKRTRPEKLSDNDYADPENRLIFGKQEFYSSMHKKVKPKTWEANLEELKETVKEDEIKLSDEEEKKKLRHQIITKYKIELFSMPWTKIIIFSFLFLAALGITLYVLIPKFVPKEQVTEEIITGESIAEIDKLIPQKIVAKQKEVSALNYFDSEIDPWKPLADKSITRLIVNNNEHEVMLPRDEALKIILGEDNFKNVPQNVLGLIDNKYDILAFKNNDVLRLGIVLKYDRNQEENFNQSMASWAETPTKAQKIHNIMKALFVNSKVEEKSSTAFQPSSYSNVNVYYLNLPDTDTSMDYFIYKGYLVFTTSKNTTSEMIDLLQQ